ncbi:OPT-domain-containing protein [Nadsonia fulvescens var. elongata DSM 6958]|uniref:OPT-domain-containing protein n=1 Tax=Nadsonia fulvescens var. elongata DSM 6958 TaxID=857566 RepID=A0A1E3PLN9_9ASCO|nr:OPT-domain-containing protein [Nadsonia fulvescens var. elongata DSM 6958]
MFGDQYSILQWCFLIGALLAPVCFYARKFFPKQLKYFNPIVFVGGMLNWAPYNLTYLTTGLYASIFFMYYIRRRYVGWWEKYNYLISAGMAAGVAFSAVIIFFSVQYHPKSVSWWGNDVSYAGVDGGVGRQVLISDLPEAGYFGPTKGSWN